MRFIAAEGFCRLLMCEAADKPVEFISRLMLIGFERVTEIAGKIEQVNTIVDVLNLNLG